MQLCPRCSISRPLSTIKPLSKPHYLPQRLQLPRRQPLSWSHFSQPRLFSNHIITNNKNRRTSKPQQPRYYSTPAAQPVEEAESFEDILPVCCPGCGAYSQTVEPDEPGYYSKTRKQLRKFVSQKRKAIVGDSGSGSGGENKGEERQYEKLGEEENVDSGHEDGSITTSESQELEKRDGPPSEEVKVTESKPAGGKNLVKEVEKDTAAAVNHLLETSEPPDPVCERCHELINHNKAVVAPTPSAHSIRAFLDESPHRDNRVYHVIDAADFPMSLIPEVYEVLSLQDQRSRNRRASTEKYKWGRRLPTVSFVITRSDLLAATKEQVDSKMERMRTVLREALGRSNRQVRLGNVHMISAQRGWWTKNVKEEIREHGGGIWVAGKTNVGKSNFIEACFPKDSRNLEKIADLVRRREQEGEPISRRQEKSAADLLDSESLLPPAPREDLYPTFPVISSFPGTTVSPIRIPFGNGKGEMIDLPGLGRNGLEDYVCDEHKRDLIMTKRRKPERFAIQPGRSLLLGGGLVRITPVNPSDTVLLAACFVPLEVHVTSTDKAIEMQTQRRKYPKEQILKEGAGDIISSAGVFDLKWDVTSSHLPDWVIKDMERRGSKSKSFPPTLPYRVKSADILVEGCGWIELTMQIRAKAGSEDAAPMPQVEVFSPNGRHVGLRLPMECYNFITEKRKSDKRKLVTRRQNVGHKRRTMHGAKP